MLRIMMFEKVKVILKNLLVYIEVCYRNYICFSFCAVPKGILQSGFSDPNIQTVLQSPASLPEQETR